MKRIVYKKYFNFFLLLVIGLVMPFLKGNTGYNYNHNGQEVHSTQGLVMNRLPYTHKDMGIIDSKDFSSPEGMFVFEKDLETKIYIVDSESNKIFELNEGYQLENSYDHFMLDPNAIDRETLFKIKSDGNYLVEDNYVGVRKPDEVINLRLGDERSVPLIFSDRYFNLNGRDLRINVTNPCINAEFVEGKFKIIPLYFGESQVTITVYDTDGETQKINSYLEAKKLDTLTKKSFVVKSEELSQKDYFKAKVTAKLEGEVVNELSFAEMTFLLDENDFYDKAFEKLIGHKTGDDVSFEYTYSQFSSNEKLKGKTVAFEITILETYQSALNVLTTSDEVAKNYEISGVENVEQYKAFLDERKVERKVFQFQINVAVGQKSAVVPGKAPNRFMLNDLLTYSEIPIYFSKPRGVYRAVNKTLAREDYLYVADTNNNQIIVVDYATKKIQKFVHLSKKAEFKNVKFEPFSIVTDAPGRIYAISNNIFQGILQFSVDGKFDRFTGVNYVNLSPWEKFWRIFKTEEQIRRSLTIINTTFTSMFVDDKGFIYTTALPPVGNSAKVNYSFMNSATNTIGVIKRINTSGKDVLRTNSYVAPQGDLIFSNDIFLKRNGASKLVSISVNKIGMYSVVDSKMGKIFTYDHEGHLLYISGKGTYDGANAQQYDVIAYPKTISYHKDRVLVLDKNARSLFIFEPTATSKLINEAVSLEYKGDFIGAGDIWEKVVRENANYSHAYSGIGKKYYAQKKYKEALKYFELGFDVNNHARAFKILRDEKIRIYFPYVIGLIVFIPLTLFTYKKIKQIRNKKKKTEVKNKDEEFGNNNE